MSLLGSTPAAAASPRSSSTRTATSLATGHHPFAQDGRGPGWVEHAPDEVWRAMLAATRAVLARVDPTPCAGSGSPTRTTPWCSGTARPWAPRAALGQTEPRRCCAASRRPRGRVPSWRARMDPKKPAGWPGSPSTSRARGRGWSPGEYAVGGLASYLVARLTRGTWHVTDVARRPRTGLLDLDTGDLVRAPVRGPPGVPSRRAARAGGQLGGPPTASDAASFCGL